MKYYKVSEDGDVTLLFTSSRRGRPAQMLNTNTLVPHTLDDDLRVVTVQHDPQGENDL